MKTILLTKGKSTIISDIDYKNIPMLSQRKWQTSGRGYVCRKQINKTTKKVECIYMHKLIMGNLKNVQVDHIDHNPLNNQRNNLRKCTASENRRNQRKIKKATSIFKGVHWNKDCKKWRACISQKRKPIHLGLFLEEKQAAQAYNLKAKELFGEFALLNTV